MRPHAHKPIDPDWIRQHMGRPRGPRRWMARVTGAAVHALDPFGQWPGGEHVTWPNRRETAPVLLYLHGGGYIACSPETHRPLVASLVRRIRGEAFVPDYRLAPEHPFPAALDDALAAYRFLIEERAIDPSRIVIAGDSAGGGLCLALAMAIRDAGLPPAAALVMFSPWTDLAATGESLDENSERCAMFAGVTIRRAAQFYVGDADARHPYISPLYGNFAGLPPMLVHASLDEVLRDDSIRIAECARAAQVPVEERLWHHVPHVWQFFVAVLPEARQSVNDAVRFITNHVRPHDDARAAASALRGRSA